MATAVRVEDIDARITAVRAALDRTGQNLLDLDNDPIRQLLGTSSLSGATAAAWSDADSQIALLWQWYRALSDIVAQVTELRGTRSRLSDDQTNHLVQLLSGPSVQLASTDVDLAQRTMTGAATLSTTCSIDQLIGTMSAAFERIAGVVAQASGVWDRVIPRLSELDAALGAVERAARSTGIKVPNDVAVARRTMAELRDRAGRDPVSVDPDELTTLAAGVDRARDTVDAALQAKGDLDRTLAATATQLDEIRVVLDRASVDRAEAATKILDADAHLPAVGPAEAELATLRTELAQLTELARSDWQDADRRAGPLGRRSAAARAEATRIASAASAGVAQRNELRGRLGAYRAKAQAVGRAEDLGLDHLYQQAQAMLYTSPCDLSEATRLVTEYQRALNRPAIEDR